MTLTGHDDHVLGLTLSRDTMGRAFTLTKRTCWCLLRQIAPLWVYHFLWSILKCPLCSLFKRIV